MALESAALSQGLPIARPIEPRDPVFGYAARMDDFGTIRLYDWIDHRTLTDADDVAPWLGRVVAALHGLDVEVGKEPAPGWMQGQDLAALISQDLRAFPQVVTHLRHLAASCLG